jgi:hypothetical protein
VEEGALEVAILPREHPGVLRHGPAEQGLHGGRGEPVEAELEDAGPGGHRVPEDAAGPAVVLAEEARQSVQQMRGPAVRAAELGLDPARDLPAAGVGLARDRFLAVTEVQNLPAVVLYVFEVKTTQATKRIRLLLLLVVVVVISTQTS